MAGHIRVKPDNGVEVDLLGGGSVVGVHEDAASVLQLAIAKLRQMNRDAPAREISLAVTHAEESYHWLLALERRRSA
jgi:hypothetical protein